MNALDATRSRTMGRMVFMAMRAVGERGTEAYYEKAHEQLPVGFVVAVQRSLRRRVDGDLRLGLHLGDDGLAQPHGVEHPHVFFDLLEGLRRALLALGDQNEVETE